MRQLRPIAAFVIAAIIQFVLLALIFLGRPDKLDDAAVPIGIIVGAVGGPLFGRSIGRVITGGAVLGLFNAAEVSAMDLPADKLSTVLRWAVSVAFCASASAGTWLWTEYSAKRPPPGIGSPQSPA